MNIRETKNEAMTSEPIPIVRSYAGQKEIITLNLNVEKTDNDEYQCVNRFQLFIAATERVGGFSWREQQFSSRRYKRLCRSAGERMGL